MFLAHRPAAFKRCSQVALGGAIWPHLSTPSAAAHRLVVCPLLPADASFFPFAGTNACSPGAVEAVGQGGVRLCHVCGVQHLHAVRHVPVCSARCPWPTACPNCPNLSPTADRQASRIAHEPFAIGAKPPADSGAPKRCWCRSPRRFTVVCSVPEKRAATMPSDASAAADSRRSRTSRRTAIPALARQAARRENPGFSGI